MKTFGKILGAVGGATLTLAGVVGLAITAIYWLDLDDKMVGKTVDAIHKAGKLKKMKRIKEEYEAAQAAGNAS